MSVVIVTGSSGYIGGQTVLQLKDAGHKVYGIDRRDPPKHLLGLTNSFSKQDVASDAALSWIIQKQPDAIIHCAGTSLVGPSMKNPSEYYNNNMVKTLRLIDIVKTSMPRCRFIFSSSASTYGTPIGDSCHEGNQCMPLSPYGESKLMIDMILESYQKAHNFNYVSFRYFNACGADPLGRHGQEPGATHIIARVLESIRDDKVFTLYGAHYNTPDGTCVRDYVHVDDIARAHLLALDTDTTIPAGIYNLGSTYGTSCKEIIAAAERITCKKLKVIIGTRRDGDPATLTASAGKFNKLVDGLTQNNY